MRRRRYRRRGRGARWLVVCGLVVLALAAVITLRFRPVFMEYAVNLCEDSALQEINNVLQDKIYADRETYENLVVLERDDENHVTALKTDVIAIGQIKAALVNGLFERLEDLEQTTVEVPLGSVFAPSLFSGMGPTVDVGMTALSQMSAEFVSAFSSAGINQTRHNILIEVRAGFRILTPFGVTYKEVKTSYPVTDTVIIGTVPEQYTYIDDTRDGLLGKINDYTDNN